VSPESSAIKVVESSILFNNRVLCTFLGKSENLQSDDANEKVTWPGSTVEWLSIQIEMCKVVGSDLVNTNTCYVQSLALKTKKSTPELAKPDLSRVV
jgi:hypothetical protein